MVGCRLLQGARGCGPGKRIFHDSSDVQECSEADLERAQGSEKQAAGCIFSRCSRTLVPEMALMTSRDAGSAA